jgi:hypothetical protein
MKKSGLIHLCLLGLLSTALVFTSCNKNDDEGTSQLKVHLTDGPADYDAVLIDVQEIEIHSDANGWQTFNILHPGIYNLLDFNNGLDTLIADATLPSGQISQMRLILGPNNSVIVNGTTYPLATPSAQQSGLKFNIKQQLDPGAVYHMWIDFDAGKSVVEQGNGTYSLKPVIRTYTELTNGQIKGVVLPAAAEAVVYAIGNTDTATAIPDAQGAFLFSGMPEGNYTVWLDATDSTGYVDSTLNNVPVVFGQVNDLGTITLSN